MRTRLHRFACAFLALCLSFGLVFPRPALADVDPVQWAGWVSESLGNKFVELVALKTEGYTPLNPVDLAAFTVAYPTSRSMADNVRALPAYKELYGSNPLDRSTVIRTYDGGKQVSILSDEGLYNAFLWLHDGELPVDSSGGSGPSDTPSVGYVVLPHQIGLLPSSGPLTVLDGRDINPSYSVASVGYDKISQSYSRIGADSSFLSYSNDGAFNLWVFDGSRFEVRLYSDGTCRLQNISNDQATCTNLYMSWNDTFDHSISSGGYQGLGVLWAYAPAGIGPVPLPDPVPPAGPSTPDIQQPTSTDVPQSDGPVQDTTINVNVTLPDGTTTIVQAPSVDLLPVVTWLSIINSNLISWADTINDNMTAWFGNVSQWLQEIYSDLEAFKLSVDNWLAAILSDLDSLGSSLPDMSGDTTNYWNNVVVYNHGLIDGLPQSPQIKQISDDLSGLQQKFPFSIPWDVLAILKLFEADPVAPAFDVPLVYLGPDGITTEDLHVDLSAFDYPVATFRRLEFIGFAIVLALGTRKLLGYVNTASEVISN